MITNRKYKTILDVSLRHDYYFDKDQNGLKPGLCSDFEIYPSLETQKVLKNIGIILKIDSTGFELIAPEERMALISEFKDPIYIELKLKKYELVYYTQLPGVDFTDNFKRNKVLFFTNRPKEDRFVSKANAYASSEDMAEKARTFLSLPTELIRKNIKRAVFILQKDVDHPLEVNFEEPVNGEAIPLDNLPNGVYKSVQYFDGNDKELKSINFSDKGLLISNSTKMIGVIEIFLDRVIKKEQVIQFKKREAFWNYIIKSKPEVNVDLVPNIPDNVKAKLVYGESAIAFDKIDDNGETVYEDFVKRIRSISINDANKFTFFRSKEELPISEVLNKGFSLVNSGGQEVIEEALTNPLSINVLRVVDEAQSHHLYSLIDISNLDNN